MTFTPRFAGDSPERTLRDELKKARKYEMLPIQRLVKLLDGVEPSHRRICTAERCACIGCVREPGITQEIIDQYNTGELQRLALAEVAKSLGLE